MTQYVRKEDYDEVLGYAPHWAVDKWGLDKPAVVIVSHEAAANVIRTHEGKGLAAHEFADMVLRAALQEHALASHEHEWVDMRNEVISSGYFCPICTAIKP